MNFKAAVVGAIAIHAIHMVFVLQEGNVAQAMWGWRMNGMPGVSSLHFTCSEGNIGCESVNSGAGCSSSNWTCTVTPNSGKTCSVSSTTLKCNKTGTAALFRPDNGGSCINVGGSSHTKDSDLAWDPAPVCAQTTTVVATQTSGAVNPGFQAKAWIMMFTAVAVWML